MKRSRFRHGNTPYTLLQLGIASWETILRRGAMIAQGTCTAAEYQRMVAEKVAATHAAAFAAARGGGFGAILAPFVSRSRANAKRLRRKRSAAPK